MRSLALLLAVASAAAPAPATAIVVRHDVPDAAYLGREADFPAVFAIFRTRAGHRDCLATMVSARYALTAAHCTEVPALVRAVAPGGNGRRVEVAGVENRIVEVIRHPPGREGRAPDMALVRLAEPVRHVRPIALYRAGDEVGRTVTIPGWGGYGTGERAVGPSDGRFRVAENRVDEAADGRLLWRFDAPSSSRALPREGISGPGDSGGPALIRTRRGWAIAGVSSAQRTGDGPEGVYGVTEVFVRVSDFAPWVDRQTRAVAAPAVVAPPAAAAGA